MRLRGQASYISSAMALSGACFVPLKLWNSVSSARPCPRPLFSASASSSSYSSSSPSFSFSCSQKISRESGETPKEYSPICLRKRMLSLSTVAVILSSPIPTISTVMAEGLDLERYTDFKGGFTLLRPSSWVKVDKAGATVLFEEPNITANNVGVVVNPVRLTNLEEFGTPQLVADKLIQAEKRKESTKDAEVIAVSERLGKGAIRVYEIEYKVDSTRGGMKRIFSAAFVTSKKLYILNIAHSDKPESPLDMHRRRILEQVLHSFDAAPLA